MKSNSEMPGVEVTVQACFQPKLYVIAPSDCEAEKLRTVIDNNNVVVMDPPDRNIHISRKPLDCEAILDLREDGWSETGFASLPV